MEENNIKILTEKIINWAKEQGRANPQGFPVKEGGKCFEYCYPQEMVQYINKMKKEISNLNSSSLRKLEDALLHVPDEKGFAHSQIIALNSIRSLVFLEQDYRRNPPQIEPGE